MGLSYKFNVNAAKFVFATHRTTDENNAIWHHPNSENLSDALQKAAFEQWYHAILVTCLNTYLTLMDNEQTTATGYCVAGTVR